MAKDVSQNLVYDTRTGREYHIHPAFINDKAWLSQRGLILKKNMNPSQVGSPVQSGGQSIAELEAKLKAEIEAKLRAEMAEEARKNEAELIAKVSAKAETAPTETTAPAPSKETTTKGKNK